MYKSSDAMQIVVRSSCWQELLHAGAYRYCTYGLIQGYGYGCTVSVEAYLQHTRVACAVDKARSLAQLTASPGRSTLTR